MDELRDPDPADRHPTVRAPREIVAQAPPLPSRPGTIVSAVRRRWPVFLSIVAAALLIALLVTMLRTPLYTATAEVVLDSSGGALGQPVAPAEGRAVTEMQIVRSREMAASVAAALRLDGAFLADDGGVIARLFGEAAPNGAADQARRIVDRLLERLAIARPADTYSLTISYTAADPELAARIANEYAAQYSGGRLAGLAEGASPLDRPFARIISRAEPPLAPSSPRPLRSFALAALLGVIGGVIGAILVERRFAGITSGQEIEKRLGLPHLGSVPTLRSVLPNATSPLDAMVSEPMSGFAEAFRGVMMAIRHAGGRGTQVIAITSALPNEGKTTIAACLARSVALGGDGVVLIDCDARRRDTTALFGLAGRRPGLAEVLRFEATLGEALVRDPDSGAWILPLVGPPVEISDLLTGPAMVGLIEDLKKRFKRILIDTAPILAMSSTRGIATLADIVVMVVRWRVTADHAVVAALHLLPDDHVRIGGIVLSQVDIGKQVKFGHGDPSFYYRQYSKYYS